jgi:Peptidase M15
MIYIIILLLPALFGCSSADDLFTNNDQRSNSKGEYIYRQHDEYFYNPALPKPRAPENYPWEDNLQHSKITKDYFRCTGSCVHPELIIDQSEGLKSYFDCDGDDAHGLPLREGKEFIYSILIDLLNYVQEETGHRVVITSGHRCPDHNSYVDQSNENLYSKHLIGAEVAFYVENLEYQPQEIISILRDYYKNEPSDYATFLRYEKSNTNVRTKPWYNKEVFIKLFDPDEGRDLDSQHPYSYIAIQVRYDREFNEKVTYSWNKAHRHYLRR